MSSAFYSVDCPNCGENIDIGVKSQGPSLCIGGTIIQDRYYIEPGKTGTSKLLDIVCKSCGTMIVANAATEQEDHRNMLGATLRLERATGGALTIKHLGGGTPGVVNFSELYPRPPQADNQGNIPLPVGGTIGVFSAHVGDIYVYRRIDPPIQVINESQTGYFSVSRKLHNEAGFSKTSHIWGKAIVAQHPHLQNSIVYEISHPNDRIHLTYHVFRSLLLERGLVTIDRLVDMPDDEQFQMFLDAVKNEEQ